MRILALDISSTTGWALGNAGEKPRVGVERLVPEKLKNEYGEKAKTIERLNHATDHIAGFIRDICFVESERPDLIIYEAAMAPFEDNAVDENGHPIRQRKIRRSVESITLPIMATAAVRAIARCYGIDRELAWPATWRKHFLGRSNFGDRDETKRQTLTRCRLLGYDERSWRDDNAADACGIFNYAAAVYGRAQERELRLFDEGRLRHG